MFERLASAVRSMVTRAKVQQTVVGPRTLLQITGLEGEVKQSVELLLPPGYSARPLAGADLVTFQVLGSRDHLVALGGDMAGQDAIADLAPGEFGLRDPNGQMVVFRGGYLQLVTPTYVKMTAAQYVEIDTPLLKVSGEIIDNFNTQTETMAGQRAVYNSHQHPVPNVQAGGSTVTTAAPVQQEL